MKKSIMQKWVKALRSGKYKQTKAVLKDDNGYCCLGVLCEIAPNVEWTRRKRGEFKGGPKSFAIKGQNEKLRLGLGDYSNIGLTVLPKIVEEWAEMATNTGDYSEIHSLTERNDDGDSFENIANIIEKYWKKL